MGFAVTAVQLPVVAVASAVVVGGLVAIVGTGRKIGLNVVVAGLFQRGSGWQRHWWNLCPWYSRNHDQ